MKQTFLLIVLFLLFLSPGCARADWDPETDYMAEMMDCARRGDAEAGRRAQALRAEKLETLKLELPAVDFDELLLLARLIQAEAGSAWLPLDWKLAVGEVVLNRVASPEFPDTLAGVVHQPGQYYGPYTWYLDSLFPSAESVLAAKLLLEGERVLDRPSVVFQSNFPQGGVIYLELRDELLGSTYLCESSRPELYRA